VSHQFRGPVLRRWIEVEKSWGVLAGAMLVLLVVWQFSFNLPGLMVYDGFSSRFGPVERDFLIHQGAEKINW